MRNILLWLAFSVFVPGLNAPATPHAHTPAQEGAARLEQAGYRFYTHGDFAAAEAAYLAEYHSAAREGVSPLNVEALNNVGGARFAAFNYSGAVRAFLEAKRQATQIADFPVVAATSGNIASIYLQMGELESAQQVAREGLAAVRRAKSPKYEWQLFTILGTIAAVRNQNEAAVRCFRRALDVAGQEAEPLAIARISGELGEALLRAGRISDAAPALERAYYLGLLGHDSHLSAYRLGLSLVRQRQGDLTSASALLSNAMLSSSGLSGPLLWRAYYQRGLLHRAKAEDQEALADLRRSVNLIEAWRDRGIPSDDLRSANQTWLSAVYDAFIETAAAQGGRWAVEAFEAADEERDASLRKTLLESQQGREKLPAEYWRTLALYRAAAAADATVPSHNQSDKAVSLRARLLEIEEQAGIANAQGNAAVDRSSFHNTVSELQRHLGRDEVLLSLHSGGTHAFLWEVFPSNFYTHSLGRTAEVSELIQRFRRAVRESSPDRDALSERVYQQLFGQLSVSARSKQVWLIAAGEELFQFPFAALRVRSESGAPVYLVEEHNLQSTPSAFLFQDYSAKQFDGPFLGIGDGIYNRVDTRTHNAPQAPSADASPRPLELNRLAGSGRELALCARVWAGPATVLTGEAASRTGLIQALRAKPSIVHIAAHVLRAAPDSGQAFIHFGLRDGINADLLTSADVASLRVPDSTIVMSGCSSAASAPLHGSGIMGLTRAWLIAGASAVIASWWDVPDDTGELFQAFYRHLHEFKTARHPAARALQAAQLDMLNSKTWTSSPRYWSAFYVAGKD